MSKLFSLIALSTILTTAQGADLEPQDNKGAKYPFLKHTPTQKEQTVEPNSQARISEQTPLYLANVQQKTATLEEKDPKKDPKAAKNFVWIGKKRISQTDPLHAWPYARPYFFHRHLTTLNYCLMLNRYDAERYLPSTDLQKLNIEAFDFLKGFCGQLPSLKSLSILCLNAQKRSKRKEQRIPHLRKQLFSIENFTFIPLISAQQNRSLIKWSQAAAVYFLSNLNPRTIKTLTLPIGKELTHKEENSAKDLWNFCGERFFRKAEKLEKLTLSTDYTGAQPAEDFLQRLVAGMSPFGKQTLKTLRFEGGFEDYAQVRQILGELPNLETFYYRPDTFFERVLFWSDRGEKILEQVSEKNKEQGAKFINDFTKIATLKNIKHLTLAFENKLSFSSLIDFYELGKIFYEGRNSEKDSLEILGAGVWSFRNFGNKRSYDGTTKDYARRNLKILKEKISPKFWIQEEEDDQLNKQSENCHRQALQAFEKNTVILLHPTQRLEQ